MAAAELVAQGSASVTHRRAACRPADIEAVLEGALSELHNDLSRDQRRHGAKVGASVLASKFGVADRQLTPSDMGEYTEAVRAVVAVVTAYELEAGKARDSGAPEPREPSLADVEAAMRLYDYLHDRVVALRMELFGSQETPFASVAEAEAWLVEQSELAAYEDREAEFFDTSLGIFAEYAGVRIIAGPRLVLLGDPALEPPGEDLAGYLNTQHPARQATALARIPNRRATHPAGRSELLARLSDVQYELAAIVGITAWEATRLILLDATPAVRRWRVQRPPAALYGPVPWFAIEVHDAQLNHQEAEQLVADLVRAGQVKRTRSSHAQRARYSRLYEFHRDRHELPVQPMHTEDIREEWNTTYPSDSYRTRSGFLKAVAKAREMCGAPRLSEVRRPERARRRRSVSSLGVGE